MELQFDWLGIQVSNLQDSVAFYRDALGFQVRHVADEFVVLKTPNGFSLELFAGGMRSVAPRLWAGVNARMPGLSAADLPRVVDELKARGVSFITPIEVESWGRYTYFVDPDGNQWQLHENGQFEK